MCKLAATRVNASLTNDKKEAIRKRTLLQHEEISYNESSKNDLKYRQTSKIW